MKKKTLLVLLIVAMVGMIVAVANGVYGLYERIGELRAVIHMNNHLSPKYEKFDTSGHENRIVLEAVSLGICFLAFIAMIIVFIAFIKRERLIVTEEEKRMAIERRIKREEQKKSKKILQLNAKLNETKNKDDI